MSDDLTVSPFYHSSVNEITKPESLTFTSHYFADRWMRDLGPTGAAIVIILRSHCYHNRKSAELRDRVQLPVAQIAAEAGVSAKTVRRELDSSKALQRFVRVHVEYAPGRTPESVRRDANSYQVAMDDPVHPLDEARLQDAIRAKAREREKGAGSEEDAKVRAKQKPRNLPDHLPDQQQKPPGQFDQAASGGLVKLTGGGAKLSLGTPKLTRGSGQNDHALESFPILKNPLESSSEVLPSAAGGQDQTDEAQTDETSEQYRTFYRQARKEMSRPDFKAKHGRPSGPADWAAGARERMQELKRQDFRPTCPATPPEEQTMP